MSKTNWEKEVVRGGSSKEQLERMIALLEQILAELKKP